MKSVDVDIDKADVENIFEQLKYEKFSGKIGFLNPESRSRAILQNGPHVGLMLLMGVCRDLSIDYGFIDQDVYMLSNDEVISIIKKVGGSQGINPNKLKTDVGSLSDKSFIQPKKG